MKKCQIKCKYGGVGCNMNSFMLFNLHLQVSSLARAGYDVQCLSNWMEKNPSQWPSIKPGTWNIPSQNMKNNKKLRYNKINK